MAGKERIADMTTLTHKERAVMALEGNQPDYVPTFEMAFQLTEEAFGTCFTRGAKRRVVRERPTGAMP